MKIPRILAASAASLAMIGLSATVVSATAASAAPAAVGSHLSAAAPATAPGKITSKVTGTFRNSHGRGTFTGKFMPKKFSVVKGHLEATGKLTGKLVNANGTPAGKVSRTITTAVDTPKAGQAAAGAPLACGVLDLNLGPLNLNLLGLVVHLNHVHLTITAVPGAGNLLGNLLCAITNLLNGGGSLSQISTLLNEVLALI
jgi:hypothetical protein